MINKVGMPVGKGRGYKTDNFFAQAAAAPINITFSG